VQILENAKNKAAEQAYYQMVKDVMPQSTQDRYGLSEFRDSSRQVISIVNILFSMVAVFVSLYYASYVISSDVGTVRILDRRRHLSSAQLLVLSGHCSDSLGLW
jgi:hypothetical protein